MTDDTPPPDIVSRLRGWRDVTATRDPALAALLIEAAEEIERLRGPWITMALAALA